MRHSPPSSNQAPHEKQKTTPAANSANHHNYNTRRQATTTHVTHRNTFPPFICLTLRGSGEGGADSGYESVILGGVHGEIVHAGGEVAVAPGGAEGVEIFEHGRAELVVVGVVASHEHEPTGGVHEGLRIAPGVEVGERAAGGGGLVGGVEDFIEGRGVCRLFDGVDVLFGERVLAGRLAEESHKRGVLEE